MQGMHIVHAYASMRPACRKPSKTFPTQQDAPTEPKTKPNVTSTHPALNPTCDALADMTRNCGVVSIVVVAVAVAVAIASATQRRLGCARSFLN